MVSRGSKMPMPPLSRAASGNQYLVVSGLPPASLSASTWWYSVVTPLRRTGRNASDGGPGEFSIAADTSVTPSCSSVTRKSSTSRRLSLSPSDPVRSASLMRFVADMCGLQVSGWIGGIEDRVFGGPSSLWGPGRCTSLRCRPTARRVWDVHAEHREGAKAVAGRENSATTAQTGESTQRAAGRAVDSAREALHDLAAASRRVCATVIQHVPRWRNSYDGLKADDTRRPSV